MIVHTSAILLLLVWFIPLLVFLRGYSPPLSIFRLAFFLSLSIVALGVLSLRIMNGFLSTRIDVLGDRIVKSSRSRKTVLPFNSVASFSCRRFDVIPGPIAFLRSPKASLSIEPFYAHLTELIELLEDRLRLQGRDEAYDEATMGRVRIQARSHERSSRRIAVFLTVLPASVSILFSVGLIAAYYYWMFPLFLAVGWALLSMLFPAIMFVAGNTIATVVISKELTRGISPVKKEQQIFALSGITVCAIYLLLGIGAKLAYWSGL